MYILNLSNSKITLSHYIYLSFIFKSYFSYSSNYVCIHFIIHRITTKYIYILNTINSINILLNNIYVYIIISLYIKCIIE